MTTQKNQNPWTMDVRVRERNLRQGSLTEKDLEKHLAALPDLADQAESFATAQPALAQPPAPVAVAPVSTGADEDFGDDEDEDDEDEDDDIDAAPTNESADEAPAPEAVEGGSTGEGEPT